MHTLEPWPITCPNCWEGFETLVDCSAGDQDYYEDCPVCCNPMRLRTRVDGDGRLLGVEVEHADG